MTDVANFNGQCKAEEIANAVTHGIGAALAAAGTIVMLVFAAQKSDLVAIVSVSIYGFSMIFLYMMSTLYHAISNFKAKRILQKLDHCSIFVLIVGSYAPVCLSLLGGTLGWTLFAVNIFCAIAGIIANAISVKKFHNISLVLYLVMGWSVVTAIKPLMQVIGLNGFMMLMAGGLLYSIGVVFYKMKKRRFMHSVWHLFVLGGSTFLYFFMMFNVI
ncbi:MAG TPA: hemolysin III family protein [Clostridiaceae bacterium]